MADTAKEQVNLRAAPAKNEDARDGTACMLL
jgi:hypothetical protein